MQCFLRKIILYPVLFGILPVLVLYTGNLNNTAWPEVYRALLVTLAATGGLLALLRLALRSWHRAGLAATVISFTFFNYYLLRDLLEQSISPAESATFTLAVAAVVLIVGVWAVSRLIRSPWQWTAPLNFISICLVLLNGLVEGFHELKALPAPSARSEQVSGAEPGFEPRPTLQQRRDIYYIILDSYARPDVLEELYDIDGDMLAGYLRAKGFQVAAQSHSNYSQTFLSIGSSLNAQYLHNLAALDPASEDRQPVIDVLQNNQVTRFLRSQGYQIISFDSGFTNTNLHNADLFIQRDQPLNAFEIMLFHNSLASVLEYKVIRWQQYEGQRSQFTQMEQITRQPGPKFVYVHLMLPHPPFIFDHNGDIREETSVNYWDGGAASGNEKKYYYDYREQVQYVNARMQQVVDQILSAPGPQPIIVIQGDHGSALHLYPSITGSCVRERLSILNAYYLPGAPEGIIYPEITPVNTFRVIFNQYFDANLDLLPDQVYFSAWNAPFDFIPVTEQALNRRCPAIEQASEGGSSLD